MSSAPLESTAEKCLCSKGLAKPGSLVRFLAAAGLNESVLGTSPQAQNVLRSDEALIRHVFNTRYSALEYMDQSAKSAEIEKREVMITTLFRLYASSLRKLPDELRRALFPSEVENSLSNLVRLVLTSRVSLADIAAHCEQRAEVDDDLLAHVMDPLQQRYVLCYYGAGVAEQIGRERVDTLLRACRMSDRAALKAWFAEIVPHLPVLSKQAPQFLRSVLLDVWRMSNGDLGGLAFEIAVLDSRLFGEMGWENTRVFAAMLRRITSPGCEVLDGFLNDEDVDTALTTAEALHQDELIQHFRKLATSFNTKKQRDLHRTVMLAAQPPAPAVPVMTRVEKPEPAREEKASQPWFRAFKIAPQVG